jgi:hypothetical protein
METVTGELATRAKIAGVLPCGWLNVEGSAGLEGEKVNTFLAPAAPGVLRMRLVKCGRFPQTRRREVTFATPFSQEWASGVMELA